MATALPSAARAQQNRCRDELGVTIGELNALVAVVACDLYEHRAVTYDEVTDVVAKLAPEATMWAGQHLGRLERRGLLRSHTRDGEGNRRYFRPTPRAITALHDWAGWWMPPKAGT